MGTIITGPSVAPSAVQMSSFMRQRGSSSCARLRVCTRLWVHQDRLSGLDAEVCRDHNEEGDKQKWRSGQAKQALGRIQEKAPVSPWYRCIASIRPSVALSLAWMISGKTN